MFNNNRSANAPTSARRVQAEARPGPRARRPAARSSSQLGMSDPVQMRRRDVDDRRGRRLVRGGGGSRRARPGRRAGRRRGRIRRRARISRTPRRGWRRCAERLQPGAADRLRRAGRGRRGARGRAGRRGRLGGVARRSDRRSRSRSRRARPGRGRSRCSGVPDLDRADALVLLVDPFSFPVEPLLADARRGPPGAAGRRRPGERARRRAARCSATTGRWRPGAVGLALSGVRVAACVSQGARPVGPEMAITAGEGNVIHELAGKPAVARLQEAVSELAPQRARARGARACCSGLVVDPNKPDYERGDFLVRGILVGRRRVRRDHGRRARPGRPGRAAAGSRRRVARTRTSRRRVGARHRGAGRARPPARCCSPATAAGSHMFADARPRRRAARRARRARRPPASSAPGEIGPVGDRNFVHGFTATMALLAPVME